MPTAGTDPRRNDEVPPDPHRKGENLREGAFTGARDITWDVTSPVPLRRDGVAARTEGKQQIQNPSPERVRHFILTLAAP
jgi:hypothetical protein